MNLSPHFTLDELTVTQHRGIDNSLPGDLLPTMRRTAMGLEAVRVRLGCAPIVVTSGYRCPDLNRAVGGQALSQHLLGEAADFISPGFGTPLEIAAALRDSDVPYDQLILEFGRWVHCSFSEHPRHQALVIDADGTRPMFG